MSVRRGREDVSVAAKTFPVDQGPVWMQVDGKVVTLDPETPVTVQHVYKDGDEIPGEGTVRVSRPSQGATVAGGVLVGARFVGLAAMAGCAAAGGGGGFYDGMGSSACMLGVAAGAMALMTTGFVVLAVGRARSATIVRGSIEVTPTIAPNAGGGSISVRF